MKHTLVSAALSLALIACRADAHGTLTATTRAGAIDIHASTAELAARVAAATMQAIPCLQRLPGVQCPATPKMYVREVPGSEIHGVTHEDFVDIEVGREASELDYVVAHELTHYFISGGEDRGREWRRLPAILEEGLCEWVAQCAQPKIGDSVRAQHALLTGTLVSGGIRLVLPKPVDSSAPPTLVTLSAEDVDRGELGVLDHALDYTRDELLAIRPVANRRALTSLGFFLVRRIGVDGLRQLVDEARENDQSQVPVARICAAAKLDPNSRREWLTSAKDIADGGAYDLLLDQARAWASTHAAAATTSARFELTWTDAAGNVVGKTILHEGSQHGPVPSGAVNCSWVEIR